MSDEKALLLETIQRLEARYRALEEKYTNLENRYIRLEKAHLQLQSDYDALQIRCDGFEQRCIRLEQENTQLKIENHHLSAENKQLREENTALRKKFQRVQFGRRSEKSSPKGKAPNASSPKDRAARKERDLSALSSETRTYDLEDSEKPCPHCGKAMQSIGDSCSQQIDYAPARFVALENHCKKYVCSHCKILRSAKRPQSALPKSIASNALLSEVVLNKYVYHWPMYRQS